MFWPLPCSGFLLSPGFNIINEDGKHSLEKGCVPCWGLWPCIATHLICFQKRRLRFT